MVASVIEPQVLEDLVAGLRALGYEVIGPTVRDRAIVYEEIESASSLPIGWTDRQEPGSYRLERRGDEARFGWAVGPHSWKRFLLPPVVRLWRARANGSGIEVEEEPGPERPYAFVGVRPCDLAAIATQDDVLLGGRYQDRDYAARREGAFVVAVNCGEPAGTCFCVSMGTGPRAEAGYDLGLTEILEGEHRFLVEAGSARGEELLASLPRREATEEDVAAAHRVTDEASQRMGRTVDTTDIRDLLARNLENPRFEDAASRCLTCGNCTMVCPTCFCTAVEDTTDLAGSEAGRDRVWDTCFSVEYSYVHGGSVRTSSAARYRQWLTHKFGTWHDQFGRSGCVGCGRCITWCPVGIDVTEELAAIRSSEEARDAND
jgi:ferredoxin